MNEKIAIFADGACRGNPGQGGFGAVIVDTKTRQVSEIGGGAKETTNNKMELTAAIEALKKIRSKSRETIIHTDSSYVVNGITKWIYGWQKNDWRAKNKKEIQNADLWKLLIKETHGKKIRWQHIAGHAGIAGNERADEIATAFADGGKLALYKGRLEKYGLDVLDLNRSAKKVSKNKARKGKAYSYVSLLDGKIMIHKTWEETERRVKGRNARFKKALSADDEKRIVANFMESRK